MDWGDPFFVLAIIAMSTIGWVLTSWIRARHGYPLEDSWSGKTRRDDLDTSRKLELLEAEGLRLTGQVSRLEERIAVLERIVTDRGTVLADEIERLRERPLI